jgi:hypothetical protein
MYENTARPICFERATGIGPALSAWEADVMPLHYARKMVQLGKHMQER